MNESLQQPMSTASRILLTGGTGFVGRAVLRMLLDEGLHVRALARSSSLGSLPEHPRCERLAGDPLDLASVIGALDGCDSVVHLVGIRRKQIKETGRSYDDIDVGSVRVIARGMTISGVRRIVLLSAGAIGKSEYVRCKARAERIVIEGGFDWTILRPAFITGPGQQWPRLIAPILTAMGFLPGHSGDVARRAGNVTLRQLGRSIIWSLQNPSSVGRILDVPAIRSTSTTTREPIPYGEAMKLRS